MSYFQTRAIPTSQSIPSIKSTTCTQSSTKCFAFVYTRTRTLFSLLSFAVGWAGGWLWLAQLSEKVIWLTLYFSICNADTALPPREDEERESKTRRTQPNTISEPQIRQATSSTEFQRCRSPNFEALKLWNVRSGRTESREWELARGQFRVTVTHPDRTFKSLIRRSVNFM